MVELVNLGVIPVLCYALTHTATNDNASLNTILDALNRLLEVTAVPGQPNPSAAKIEECGGLDTIESLQSHQNGELYDKYGTLPFDDDCRAVRILKAFLEETIECDIEQHVF